MQGILFNLLARSVGGERIKRVSSRRGGEYHSPCPVCGGSDRFLLFPEQPGGQVAQEHGVKGTWACPRHCHKGGDAISFCVDLLGMSFPEACAEVGIRLERRTQGRRRRYRPLGKVHRQPGWQPKEYKYPSEEWRSAAKKLQEKGQQGLLENDICLHWLAKRGLGRDAVEAYGLGYLEGEDKRRTGLFRARSAFGLPPVRKKGREQKAFWIPRGITIPCMDRQGEVLRIRIRRRSVDLGPKDSKYLLIPQAAPAYSSPMMLYPRNIRPELTTWVVVESELDAMSVHYACGGRVGVISVLSISGRPDVRAHAALSVAPRILVALDYDEDKRAAATNWKWWQNHYVQARLWPVPVGKDPGEAVEQGVDLSEWVGSGLPQGTPRQESAEETTTATPISPPPVIGYEIPDAVSRLAELWQSTPIKIVLYNSGFRWVFDEFWCQKNAESWLEFMTAAEHPDVWKWFGLHGTGTVTAQNFLRPRG